MRKTLPLLALLALSVFAGTESYSTAVVAKPLLRTSRTSSGGALSFPGANGEVTGLDVIIPAGKSTGWHLHDRSGFAYVLSGTLQVRLDDSTSRIYKPGDAFAEVVGTLHEGVALGSENVHLVAFFLSDSGKPVTRKPEVIR